VKGLVEPLVPQILVLVIVLPLQPRRRVVETAAAYYFMLRVQNSQRDKGCFKKVQQVRVIVKLIQILPGFFIDQLVELLEVVQVRSTDEIVLRRALLS